MMFFVAGMGCLLILSEAGGSWLVLGAVLVGLGMGAETDLLSYTASRYFPPRALARALGAAWIFFAWGGALGVFAGSLCFDLTGSYRSALALYVACAIASACVTLLLGPYRYVGEVPRPSWVSPTSRWWRNKRTAPPRN